MQINLQKMAKLPQKMQATSDRGDLFLTEAVEVAEHEGAVFAAEVHAVTFAERESLAGLAIYGISKAGDTTKPEYWL